MADEAHRAVLLPDLTAEAGLHAMDEPALLAFIDETIELWHEWGKLIDVKTDVRQPLLKTVDTLESDLLGLDLLLVDDDPDDAGASFQAACRGG